MYEIRSAGTGEYIASTDTLRYVKKAKNGTFVEAANEAESEGIAINDQVYRNNTIIIRQKDIGATLDKISNDLKTNTDSVLEITNLLGNIEKHHKKDIDTEDKKLDELNQSIKDLNNNLRKLSDQVQIVKMKLGLA